MVSVQVCLFDISENRIWGFAAMDTPGDFQWFDSGGAGQGRGHDLAPPPAACVTSGMSLSVLIEKARRTEPMLGLS